MGGRGSGPRPRGVPPRNTSRPSGRTRSSGTPIDPRGPPVYHDIAQVLYPATTTGLPSTDIEDPMFDLQDATIFQQDGKTMANLLEVALDGPFIVKGKMIVEEDTEKYLAVPKCKSVYVQTSTCNMFSMGYGPLCLWAWSVGGWLEIKPAKVYRETYFNMFEAITLYWEIMAAYQALEDDKKSKRKSKMSIRQTMLSARLDEIFYHYAKNAGDGVLFSEVEKRCDKHALFLLGQFDQQSDFDWRKTSFFHWMHKRHPDIVAKLEAQKTKNAVAAATTTSSSSRTRSSVDIEMSGTSTTTTEPSNGKSRHVKPEPSKPLPARTLLARTLPHVPPPSGPLSTIRAPASTPPTAVKSGLTTNLPATNLPTIVTLLEEIAAESDAGYRSTYGKFTSEMYKKCKLSNSAYSIPKEILQLYAADLLKTLDPERWKGTTMWEGLEKEAKEPITKLVHLQSIEEIPERLVRRQHRALVLEEVGTPSRVPNRSYAGKTPRLSLSVAKKRPLEEMNDESDGEATPVPNPVGPSSVARSTGTDAVPPKRRGRPPKMSKAEPGLPQNQSTENTDDESSDESDSGIAGTPTKVVLRSYPLQLDKPTGPMGTWVCSEAGCGHVIRSAKETMQRLKVLEHMQEHTNREMELAEQAREEGQRNGLPVSKLLEKIMNDAKKPPRIKRAQLGW
ncbi:hypothetical protein PspLS_08777 [Pyricularia sp. CBS 133598]|nr:hypothetical protein PspLS_08777 [Pyricularia sp. CBS 133598]